MAERAGFFPFTAYFLLSFPRNLINFSMKILLAKKKKKYLEAELK